MAVTDSIIAGTRFHLLTFIGYPDLPRHSIGTFLCDCGTTSERRMSPVIGGKLKSCGCFGKTTRFAGDPLHPGQKMNDATLVRCLGIPEGKTNIAWECLCKCGVTFMALASNLRSGNTMSCGCRRRSLRNNRSHGMSKHKIFSLWSQMIQRCHFEGNAAYKNYGGRGITVCERWHKFENFYEDFGQFRAANLTIDRIDNNLGYGPGNCRWSTKQEQGRNRRGNLPLTIKGETRLLCEWAELSGLDSSLIRARKVRLGWCDDDLLAPPWSRKRANH